MTGTELPSQRMLRGSALLPTIGLLGIFAYFVLVGGTARGELDAFTRLLNTLIGGGLIATLVWRLGGAWDDVDRGVIAALALFVWAGVFSLFPRQSFDAALGATAYVAALSVARGKLADPTVRRLTITVLIALSVVLTLIATRYWLVPLLEWWALTGWRVAPPLNLELAGWPWGHRHDLALLIVMLYPTWWFGDTSVVRRAVAFAVGLIVALIVLVDGSRNLWLAIAVATVAIGVPVAWRLWTVHGYRARVAVAVTVILVASVLMVAGMAQSLLERATSLASLGFRAAMLGPLTEAWAAHPLAGVGIGAFPWSLQLTDYFASNSWAPLHPDSAVIQMLVEGGISGVAALVVLVIALGGAIARSRSRPAQFALTTFAVAAVGGNPTVFPFLVAVAIVWVGMAAPRRAGPNSTPISHSRLPRAAALTCLAVIGIAQGLHVAGGFAYEDARAAVMADRVQDAQAAVGVAVALDPAMALYHRQAGALHLLNDEREHAIEDLTRATEINPVDDLAWRTLAHAYDFGGADTARDAAMEQAIDVQRSDPTNLLVRARWDLREGAHDAVAETLAEIVQAWPTIVFAPGWQSMVPPSTTSQAIIERALERWEIGAPSPQPLGDQGLWLTAMLSGDPDSPRAGSTPWSAAMTRAFQHAMHCDPEAQAILDDAPDADQRSPLYWWLQLRASIVDGDPDMNAVHMAGLMRSPVVPAVADALLNPLNENGQFSADAFGYRRAPIAWPSVRVELPSPSAGWVRWMLFPSDAVEAAGLGDRLEAC